MENFQPERQLDGTKVRDWIQSSIVDNGTKVPLGSNGTKARDEATHVAGFTVLSGGPGRLENLTDSHIGTMTDVTHRDFDIEALIQHRPSPTACTHILTYDAYLLHRSDFMPIWGPNNGA